MCEGCERGVREVCEGTMVCCVVAIIYSTFKIHFLNS